jgi:flavodoxin
LKSAVLYESLYGNTERVAHAIAEGLRPAGEVTVTEVGAAQDGLAEGADLLVVGAPTHGRGMSTPESRGSGKGGTPSRGMREWLEGSAEVEGRIAAVFDTRFDKPRWLTGSAALRIARKLEALGYHLVRPPESFFVGHTEGPLADGEEARATRWGMALASMHGDRLPASPGENP